MKTLLLRLEDSLDAQFTSICRREGYQKTGVIRRLLQDFIASFPISQDPVARAEGFGIDLNSLKENLKKSPTQRLQNMEQAVAFAEQVRLARSRSDP